MGQNVLGRGDYDNIKQSFENAAPNDYWIRYAENRIKADYGDTVSVAIKNKELFKFGATTIGTSEKIIMQLQGTELAETYVSTNLINRIVSSDNNNTQDVVIEGHTIDTLTGLLTFVVQTVTLTGQTPATIPIPLARVTRMYVNDYLSSSLASGSTIYAFQSTSAVTLGVPQDNTKIHIVIVSGASTVPMLRNNQSQKCSTTLSSGDYLIITSIYADLDRGTGNNASADIFLKWRQIDANGAKLARSVFVRSLSFNGSSSIRLSMPPYIIIPKNADVFMTAIGSTTGVVISAGFNGVLASVQ